MSNYEGVKPRGDPFIPKRVSHLVYEYELTKSLEYVKPYIGKSLFFFDESKQTMWDYALQNVYQSGIYAEFGVHKGESINYLASNINQIIHGFDSFEGLDEPWLYYIKGSFNLDGKLPEVKDNVILHKGWFKNSIPKFLDTYKDKFSFMNIDCDTYNSTKTILTLITKNRMREGTIILFDEYIGYIGWETGEYKAWQEFASDNDIDYSYLAFNHLQALVKITKI
jgi:hypothetical protein